MPPLLRKGHFLGAKLRTLRKRNALTLEELSARCIQRDAQLAPSVSYLSMIESGKRTPSQETLELLAAVFQREPAWFLDESADLELSPPQAPAGGAARIPLEPAFLFSKDVLQAAIPELLAQTGTSGTRNDRNAAMSGKASVRNAHRAISSGSGSCCRSSVSACN